MKITYSIDEQDFLDFQLFTASRSEEIRKRRFRARVFPPLMYLVLGLVLFFYHRLDFTMIFALLAVVWFFFYPVREKRLYRSSYERFIRENFREKFGKPATLTIDDRYMINKDAISENKISTDQLAEISEIPGLILIRLKKGQTFILPKDKIEGPETFRDDLKALAVRLNVAYNDDPAWVWK